MTITIEQLSGNPMLTPILGTWTHTEGAAEETISLRGRVMLAKFEHNDTDAAHDVQIPYSTSVSSGVTTLTVHAQATVTTGRFAIFYLPN